MQRATPNNNLSFSKITWTDEDLKSLFIPEDVYIGIKIGHSKNKWSKDKAPEQWQKTDGTYFVLQELNFNLRNKEFTIREELKIGLWIFLKNIL